VVSFIFFSQLD